DVQPQPVLVHPAGDGAAQERLARVVDVGSAVGAEGLGEGVAEAARAVAEVGLVEHEGGGADLLGDAVHVHAAHLHGAVGRAPGGLGPEPVDQVVDVRGVRQPGGGGVVAVKGSGF